MNTGVVRGLARLAYHQARNVIRYASGASPTLFPCLEGMTLDADDVAVAREWLCERARWSTQDEAARYHELFASWNGSRHAYSFMAGRAALSAIIHALGIGRGDQVIVPGYTCVVVANAFHYAGVDTAFCDIELDTYGLDASQVDRHVKPNTKGLLIQHLYGLVSRDYGQLLAIARRHNLRVIEDCAHSTGAEYRGTKVGNLGDAAFYSSEQSKVFNSIQGGIAVTNDAAIARRLAEYRDTAGLPEDAVVARQLRNVWLQYCQCKHPQRWLAGELAAIGHGRDRLMSTIPEEELGVRPQAYGRAMPSAVAALAINQLKKIDTYNQCRRATATRWDRWCDKNGYAKPVVIADSTPVFLRYPILVEPERKLDPTWSLRDPGVRAGIWFKSHLHPSQRTVIGCPNADRAVRQCINFPCLL